jgi:RNA polymerase sigma-70 factor (ECF subfamily)
MRQSIDLDRFHDADESYVRDLIRQHAPGLRGRIMRFGVDSDDADDLVQETWLRAIERRSQYIGQGSFAAWLSRICHGLYVDQLRSYQRHRVRLARFSNELCFQEVQGAESDDESHALERAELAARLRAEIAALPSLQRRVATQRWLVGRSVEQTASDLGVATGTVKACLHQARVKLRVTLTTATPATRSNESMRTYESKDRRSCH